ncbi:hypothetical protein ACMG4L_05980 [Alcanivorax sp. IL1]
MERKGSQTGLATICISLGQCIATMIERA